MQQIEVLIYGKIIIDDIRLASGKIVRGVLGGGGPQGVFGARLWHDSVGFLSRSGDDIEAEHVQTLQELCGRFEWLGQVRWHSHSAQQNAL